MDNKSNENNNGKFKKIFLAIGVILLMLFVNKSLLGFNFEYFPIIIIVIVSILFLIPSISKKFQNKSKILATSKIRSVAMGEVELVGKIEAIELIQPPLGNNKCIGYSYIIEEPYKNKEGEKAYRTIHSESQFQDFILKDETGKVLVKHENMNLIDFFNGTSFMKDGKRHTQITLYPNLKVIIGEAISDEKGNPVITFGSRSSTYGITPLSSVKFKEENAPFFKQFITLGILFLLSILLMVGLNISLSTSGIQLNQPVFKMPELGMQNLEILSPNYSESQSLFVKLLLFINSNPFIMVGFASFGILILTFVIIGISKINKALFNVGINRFTWIVGWSIGLIFILGFPSQILLMFLGIPAYKMFFIYIVMCIYCIVFAATKTHSFNSFSGSLTSMVNNKSE